MALYSSNTSSTKINNRQELSHLNILSVDFDWIMAPSINLYNNMVREDGTDIWAAWTAAAPGCILLPDLHKYSLLCTYLGDNVDHLQPQDFYTCDSHAEIINKIHEWIPANTTFNICNIDHHHDTGYRADDGEYTWDTLVDQPGCGNWVSVLKNQYGNYFQSYVWLANENSDFNLLDGVEEQYQIYHPTTDIYELANLQFDKVFICCSRSWVPPEYRYLFDSLVFLLEKIINK